MSEYLVLQHTLSPTINAELDTGDMVAGIVYFFLKVLWFIFIAFGPFIVFNIICKWKIFVKAGAPGWASLIPFYDTYVYFKIAFGSGWAMLPQIFLSFVCCFNLYSQDQYALLLFVMLVFINFVISVFACIDLARHFGKSNGFAVGLFFLPFVFQPILAFDKSQYS